MNGKSCAGAVIRAASVLDAPGIHRIYAPIVATTPISFEIEAPTVQEVEERIQATMMRYPWLVCECEEKIAGYAYASMHRSRVAYQWSAEVSLYIDEDYQGQGIGRKLYETLFSTLKEQGYRNLAAGITLPNIPSVGIHEALGFRHVGTFKSFGYKMGEWHDVGWWQLKLREYTIDPEVPKPNL